MRTHKSRLLLTSALAFACFFIQTLPVGSQCMLTGSSSGTGGGGTYRYVVQTFSDASSCSLTMFMNAFACFPGGQTPTGPNLGITGSYTLTASARTTATNPSCQWDCNCGTVTINAADGLPVELMDFGIVGEETAEGP